MKMITAIINKRDASFVSDALKDGGFSFTKIATSGGFLQDGNTTLLIGTPDDKVEAALSIIRHNCAKRTAAMPAVTPDARTAVGTVRVAEVTVGGATVFVTDVLHFEKM